MTITLLQEVWHRTNVRYALIVYRNKAAKKKSYGAQAVFQDSSFNYDLSEWTVFAMQIRPLLPKPQNILKRSPLLHSLHTDGSCALRNITQNTNREGPIPSKLTNNRNSPKSTTHYTCIPKSNSLIGWISSQWMSNTHNKIGSTLSIPSKDQFLYPHPFYERS